MEEGKMVQEDSDNEDAIQIARLVAGFIQHTLNKAEHNELNDWVNECMENQCMFERLTNHMYLQEGLHQLQKADTEPALYRARQKLFQVIKRNRK